MPSVTLYLKAFVNESFPFASSSNTDRPVGKGVSNNTYAQFNLKTGSNAVSYFWYRFDTSSIPDGVIINSVSCRVKATVSTTNSSYLSYRYVSVYTGSTERTWADLSTSTNTLTLSSTGTWTLEELRNNYLYFYAKRDTTSVNNTQYIRVYGAEMTVSYTVMRKLTIENRTNRTVSPAAGVTWVQSNLYQSIEISGDTRPRVYWNGNDATSRFSQTSSGWTTSIPMTSDGTLVIKGDTGLFIKKDGQYRNIRRIFKKVNGRWEEQSGNPFSSASNDTNTGYNLDKNEL